MNVTISFFSEVAKLHRIGRKTVLTSISLALDQLLSDFFCSIISTQSAFGLFMDFGLFSE